MAAGSLRVNRGRCRGKRRMHLSCFIDDGNIKDGAMEHTDADAGERGAHDSCTPQDLLHSLLLPLPLLLGQPLQLCSECPPLLIILRMSQSC